MKNLVVKRLHRSLLKGFISLELAVALCGMSPGAMATAPSPCNALIKELGAYEHRHEGVGFKFLAGGRFNNGQRLGESGNFGGAYRARIEVGGNEILVIEKTIEISPVLDAVHHAELEDLGTALSIAAAEKGYGPQIYGFRNVLKEGRQLRTIYMEEVHLFPDTPKYASLKNVSTHFDYWFDEISPEEAAKEFPGLTLHKFNEKTARANFLAGAGALDRLAHQYEQLDQVHPDGHIFNYMVSFRENAAGDLQGNLIGIDWTNPSFDAAKIREYLARLRAAESHTAN